MGKFWWWGARFFRQVEAESSASNCLFSTYLLKLRLTFPRNRNAQNIWGSLSPRHLRMCLALLASMRWMYNALYFSGLSSLGIISGLLGIRSCLDEIES